MTGERTNEWMNERIGGLFRRLCHVFEVCLCADGSYLSIWRGNHVVVDAFSQRTVNYRTNLSIKGTWTYKYHQRGVSAQLQSPSSFSPITSGTRATVCVWNTAVMGRLDLFAVLIVFMYSDIQLTSAWYVVYFWRKMFVCFLMWAWRKTNGLISFHRTVNNFLMTGPKVNISALSHARRVKHTPKI